MSMTELAEVKRQAAWDALTAYADTFGDGTEPRYSARYYRDRHYAPTPRSVTLSDGTVVEMRVTSWCKPYLTLRGSGVVVTNWRTLAHTGADFDALKAFAASVEGR